MCKSSGSLFATNENSYSYDHVQLRINGKEVLVSSFAMSCSFIDFRRTTRHEDYLGHILHQNCVVNMVELAEVRLRHSNLYRPLFRPPPQSPWKMLSFFVVRPKIPFRIPLDAPHGPSFSLLACAAVENRCSRIVRELDLKHITQFGFSTETASV